MFGEYENGWLGPNGEGRKYNDGWVLLGTDTAGSVGFDRVKIPVGKNEGGFKQLRVSVKDRDVTMTNLAVVYNDGAKDEIETNRTKIAADDCVRARSISRRARPSRRSRRRGARAPARPPSAIAPTPRCRCGASTEPLTLESKAGAGRRPFRDQPKAPKWCEMPVPISRMNS